VHSGRVWRHPNDPIRVGPRCLGAGSCSFKAPRTSASLMSSGSNQGIGSEPMEVGALQSKYRSGFGAAESKTVFKFRFRVYLKLLFSADFRSVPRFWRATTSRRGRTSASKFWAVNWRPGGESNHRVGADGGAAFFSKIARKYRSKSSIARNQSHAAAPIDRLVPRFRRATMSRRGRTRPAQRSSRRRFGPSKQPNWRPGGESNKISRISSLATQP
jgi:hypothetical protein